MPSPLFILLFSFLPFPLVSTTCFTPNGTDRNVQAGQDYYAPCNPEAKFSMCCNKYGDGDECQPSGLCKNGDNLWRESCTDQSWQDAACVKLFLNGTEGPQATVNDVALTSCHDGSLCTSSGGLGCCAAGEGYFVDANGDPTRTNPNITTSLPLTTTTATSSSATSSSATSSLVTSSLVTSSSASTSATASPAAEASPTATPSPDNSSRNIGIGVGVGAGVPLLLGAIALFWFFRRHTRKSRAQAWDPQDVPVEKRDESIPLQAELPARNFHQAASELEQPVALYEAPVVPAEKEKDKKLPFEAPIELE